MTTNSNVLETNQNIKTNSRRYRTSKNAGTTAIMPSSMVTITHPQYQNALSFYQKKSDGIVNNAYLAAVKSDSEENELMNLALSIEGNQLYWGNTPVIEADFHDLITDKRIDRINTQLLSAVYSVLYANHMNMSHEDDDNKATNDYSVIIYMPDFMAFIGCGRNYSKSQLKSVLDSLKVFYNIIGIIEKADDWGCPYRDRYALLMLHDMKDSTNTIHISSPYMHELIKILNEKRIAVNNKGKQIMNGGNPVTIPNYSFLIKGSLATARNRRAADVVTIIIPLIEQAGRKNIPGITAKTIIERCPRFQAALDAYDSTRSRNRLLNRTFSTAWQYLRAHTLINERYKDFEYPSTIPTMKTLSQKISFKHQGLKKE